MKAITVGQTVRWTGGAQASTPKLRTAKTVTILQLVPQCKAAIVTAKGVRFMTPLSTLVVR